MTTIKAPKVGSEEVIEITLTPEKYPIAYKNKVDELVEQGAFNTREEAEHWVKTTPICLELLYEKHSGLFAIESGAIETNICVSPYSSKTIISHEEANSENNNVIDIESF